MPDKIGARIAQYVEREEKREVFRQDSLKAWDEYRATGLHVTAEEADAWLAQLSEGNDIEPPRNAPFRLSGKG